MNEELGVCRARAGRRAIVLLLSRNGAPVKRE